MSFVRAFVYFKLWRIVHYVSYLNTTIVIVLQTVDQAYATDYAATKSENARLQAQVRINLLSNITFCLKSHYFNNKIYIFFLIFSLNCADA